MTVAIFSIDGGEGAFMYYCRVHGLTDTMQPLKGCYKGVEEDSYIISLDKFDKYLRDSLYLRKQESILLVTGCNKAYATLEYLKLVTRGGSRWLNMVELGSMHEVPEWYARTQDAWTYRPDTNNWFVCAKGNPDHSIHEKRELPAITHGDKPAIGTMGKAADDYLDNMELADRDTVVCVTANHSNMTVGKTYQVKRYHPSAPARVQDNDGFWRVSSERFRYAV